MCKEHKGEGGYRLLGKNRVISIEIFMFKEIKIITFTFEFAKFTGLLSWKSVVMVLTEDYWFGNEAIDLEESTWQLKFYK